VQPSDYRVAEVRLLHEAATVGDREADNLLIRGDALNALASLAEIPEHVERYVGQVKLAYLDPPFNTQQSFLHYDDGLEHSVWLTMMRDRLEQVRNLLAPDGSVWVHLDDSEMAYCRVLMDELFGRSNFVGSVVWERRYTQSSDATISLTHDYLLVYATNAALWKMARNTRAVRPPRAHAATGTGGGVDQQARQRGGCSLNSNTGCLIRLDRLRPAVRSRRAAVRSGPPVQPIRPCY
jgi:adenine-specific DNA-methyltransferase